MIISSGVALLILDAPGGTVSDYLSGNLTGTVFFGVPVPEVVMAGLVFVWLIIKRTNWGLGLFAIGADLVAATLAGLPSRRVTFFAYAGAGILYGLAGFFLTALNATGAPTSGEPYLLLAFAAIAWAVHCSRVAEVDHWQLLAAITLVLLQKVLFAAGVSSFYTGIFQGAVMIGAVLIAAITARLSLREEG